MSDLETRFRLGRRVEHDPASRGFEYQRRVIKPYSVTHTLRARALDQGDMSACTGFAGAQWLNCATNISARTAWNNKSMQIGRAYCDNEDGIGLYGMATRFDEWSTVYPPVDGGSSGLGVVKALRNMGVIERYEWTFDFPAFLAALQLQPVLLGVSWFEEMFYPDHNGRIWLGGQNYGGHEILARGVNHQRKLIRIRNNWGPSWGINGDAYIGFEDMKKLLLDEQGDVVIPIRKVIPSA